MILYDSNGKSYDVQLKTNSGYKVVNNVLSYQVVNDICYIWIKSFGDKGLTGGQYNHIGNIPYSFITPTIASLSTIGASNYLTCRVETNGSIAIHTPVGTSHYGGLITIPIK